MLEDKQKENWNNFILAQGGSFLQSWEWGEFQEHVGRRVFRFSNHHPEFISGSDLEVLKQVQDDKIGWAAQFIENKLPGVNKFYWHCPRGPVTANSEGQMANSELQGIIDIIKKSAGKEVIFFRLGPGATIEQLPIGQLNNSGFKQLPYDIEPSQTLILDITKTEDELLAQTHEKWRYNIRLAQKKGVQVKVTSCDDVNFEHYFEEFYRLVSEGTAERKNIKHHQKEYYKKQLEINSPPASPDASRGGQPPLKGGSDSQLKSDFKGCLKSDFSNPGSPPLEPVLNLIQEGVGGDFESSLFVAEYEGKVIAANIVVIFGSRATYLHGATSSEHREVMAPHLLQWEQIKYAKAQGCAEYDFWGIVNEHTLDKRGQSWEGFTRFKRGFGGREVNYVGYWDYPLNKPWYWLYRLVQKFRR